MIFWLKTGFGEIRDLTWPSLHVIWDWIWQDLKNGFGLISIETLWTLEKELDCKSIGISNIISSWKQMLKYEEKTQV